MEISQFEVDVSKLDFILRDKLNGYLSKLVEGGGSDLHIKSGGYIYGRFNGEIRQMNTEIMSQSDSITLAKELLRSRFKELVDMKNIDFTHKLNDDYRFRVNIFFQMEGVSAVFRTIPTKIPNFEELYLPPIIEKICDTVNRGIILVTGPTGSGKTTTLASMINRMNAQKKRHIITIEDPIEYVYTDQKSIVNQRAIGQDASGFSDALRASLREDPDVILVGEMRDLETVKTAMAAAETGHLVLSTLHTLDAKETVGRVINMFPKEEQNRIKMTFASVVEAIISQRLVRTLQNTRRPAVEVMIKNVRIKNMIMDGREGEIYDAIEQSKNTYGMQTFDQHLLELYNEEIIDLEEALEKSSKRNNLEIKIKNANLAKEGMLDLASGEEDYTERLKRDVIALKDLDS
ncbi:MULTISPECIES: type IV pilus twitching motility protein PilT [unclassified Campylobacter]|uniref:type IV pilus twitching motility protein PilT n=1 Tax=Campylobacter TaxID=194 RepID=UPI001552C00A|nr:MULTISPECIES: PilT/PilU family type 4a pilus ATPase [unclassified Campylobacter]QKF92896.1 type II/IV secretion system protein, PilT/PilU family [Campylobacter sp. CCUG 57310]